VAKLIAVAYEWSFVWRQVRTAEPPVSPPMRRCRRSLNVDQARRPNIAAHTSSILGSPQTLSAKSEVIWGRKKMSE
jgi:hypothetical protein